MQLNKLYSKVKKSKKDLEEGLVPVKEKLLAEVIRAKSQGQVWQ